MINIENELSAMSNMRIRIKPHYELKMSTRDFETCTHLLVLTYEQLFEELPVSGLLLYLTLEEIIPKFEKKGTLEKKKSTLKLSPAHAVALRVGVCAIRYNDPYYETLSRKIVDQLYKQMI